MVRARQKKRGKLPAVQKLAFPESEWSRFMKSRLVELDAVQAEHEQKWGIERVITLVPSEFRERFYAQSERVWAAQSSQDEGKLKAACDGMVRAFRAMDAWATSEGLEPISQVKAVEGQTELGMMVVVQDEEDAVQYQALRSDVKQVWTIAELSRLVAAGIGEDLWRLKQEIPVRGFVAAVQQATGSEQRPQAKPVAAGGASGFEDMENDLDIDKPVDFPKMFQAPPEARKG
jgi:hypothetical protein